MNIFKKIIEESFGQYAGAVAQSRALVDVRDGLKPSNRQINYCLYTDKFLPNKPFKKTLKAIGSISRLYVHGDASAEGIIMRSGQPFALRYPLMEVEGNGGNLMMSGNWAAPRYTSARLGNFGVLMFNDIDKNTIKDWRDNYDDTEQYPTVLPSKGFYNIVNGTMGIATGVASSIPQFNIKDVNKALETLLLNPKCSFEDIYCQPDFATGGYLINEREVKNALKYGCMKNAKENNEEGASCKIRAKIDYNEKENCLVVTEMPYSVYTNTICNQLEQIINDSESNPGIDRFNDLTGVTPLIKIYLNKGVNYNNVIKYLYKNTSLQYHYAINMTMLDKGKYPKIFTWKEALQAHIDHECEVYRRGFEYDLIKIKKRIHIIDGLLICLASIDEVVSLIKSSSSTAEAKERLMNKFLLDEEQAKSVLAMKLSSLARLEVQKLEQEKTELEKEINKINNILNNKNLFNNELIKTWKEVALKYGDDHRTKIIEVLEEKDTKETIPLTSEDVVVIFYESGNIKRVPVSSYTDKLQKRGGKGVKNKDDIIRTAIKTNTVDHLMLFTAKGKMYRILVDEVPSDKEKGVPASSLIKMDIGDNVVEISSLHRKSNPEFVIFITKKGLVKKTLLSEYINSHKKNGLIALKLNPGDELVNIIFQDTEDLILVTRQGMSIRISTEEIRPIARNTAGVKGITLLENDYVVSGLPVHKSTDTLALFTKSGLGKSIAVTDFIVQSRGTKGSSCWKLESEDEIAAAAMISPEDYIFVHGSTNNICFSASELTTRSKSSGGLIVLKSGSLISITKI